LPSSRRLAPADGCKALANTCERAQSECDLRIGRRDENRRKDTEIRQQIGSKRPGGCCDFAGIDCDSSPNGHIAKARRQFETALQSEKLCPSRSDDPMPMNVAVGQFVSWQSKFAIPQRPRPQDGISRLDLPIEPRERPIEARIREHIRNKQPSVRAA